MALTLVKEDGTGKSDANSYAEATDGDAYHEGHLYASTWTAASADNKDKALVMATRLIDTQYQFNGLKTNPDQALQWPRRQCRVPDEEDELAADAVPKAVVDATCEMARELIITDRTTAPPGEGIIAVWTDVSGTKYSRPADRRPIITAVAQAMLAKLGALIKGRSGAVALVRT